MCGCRYTKVKDQKSGLELWGIKDCKLHKKDVQNNEADGEKTE